MKPVALIFDVVESRQYFNRYDVQNLLITCVQYLNNSYKEQIKKEVVASAGDEFQGLFINLQSAFAYIRKLQLLVYPIKIRCGIGLGDIKYDIERWPSTAFDGEAYYLCRDAISSISGKKSNAICFNTSSEYDKYINTFCKANFEIKARQSQIARLIEMLADIIYPINNAFEDPMFYSFIIDERMRLINSETWNRVSGKYREIQPYNIDFDYLFHERYNTEQVSTPNNCSIVIEDYWRHGMSTFIANSLNTTRQNVDRYVSLGRIKESRTMDKALYDLLGENI